MIAISGLWTPIGSIKIHFRLSEDHNPKPRTRLSGTLPAHSSPLSLRHLDATRALSTDLSPSPTWNPSSCLYLLVVILASRPVRHSGLGSNTQCAGHSNEVEMTTTTETNLTTVINK